jgi:hypothetical protein
MRTKNTRRALVDLAPADRQIIDAIRERPYITSNSAAVSLALWSCKGRPHGYEQGGDTSRTMIDLSPEDDATIEALRAADPEHLTSISAAISFALADYGKRMRRHVRPSHAAHVTA